MWTLIWLLVFLNVCVWHTTIDQSDISVHLLVDYSKQLKNIGYSYNVEVFKWLADDVTIIGYVSLRVPRLSW